jgi:hypothetical protein
LIKLVRNFVWVQVETLEDIRVGNGTQVEVERLKEHVHAARQQEGYHMIC